MIYLRLFYEFFKIGLFSIGGGMATFPFLTELAEKTGWFTTAQLADMVAVSESTPGPIGVNTATYVGFTVSGVAGSLVATLGLITPSIIVILIIAKMLESFRDNRAVQAAFYGLRPASTGLIAAAGVSVVMLSLVNRELYAQTGLISDLISWKGLILAAVLLVLTNGIKQTKNLHPVVFIALSAVAGIVFHFAGV